MSASSHSTHVGPALRLLLVTKGLDIGGIERMVVGVATGLARRNASVEVAIVNGRRDQLVQELQRSNVVVHALDGNDRIGRRGLVGLVRLLRSGAFDIVHVHGPLVSVVARLTPGAPPVVSTCHTPNDALRRSTRVAWRLTAGRDAATIAVSEVVAATIESTAIVIPHAADLRAASGAATDRHSVDESSLRLIAVASHRSVKNHPNLLRAVEIARRGGVDLSLDIYGEGSELDANIEIAKQLNVDDIVRFRRPELSVLGAIAAADLLVVASDFEGQPLVVSEALAVGTPVIATDVGRVSELVGEDVGRVVPVRDPQALADAIMELAASPDLRQQLSAVARRQAAAWTLDDVLDAHVALYASVRS